MSGIIVPVSGGKDSTATLLLALEDGRKVTPVFNETGWDHPDTYDYLRYLEQQTGLTIARTTYAEAPTMPDIIRKFGKFPWGMGRFCTSEYKRTAFIRWLDTVPGDYECWLGIRQDESTQRAKKYGGLSDTELLSADDLFPRKFPKRIKSRMQYRLPLCNWTREQVFSFIASRGYEPNPLYSRGFDRVGCFPCLLAGKPTQELAFADPFGKKQFEIIRMLSAEIGEEYKFPTSDSTCEACKI